MEQLHVRDGVPLFVYVKHQGFDRDGKLLPQDGSAFPGASKRGTKVAEATRQSTPFDRRGDVDEDPGQGSSSLDEDDDEDINYDDDADEPNEVHSHVFTVDLVVRYPDGGDEILLHWGMSRKQAGAWGSPD